MDTQEEVSLSGEKPPRPLTVWICGTIAYALGVTLLGLFLFEGVNPEPAVFPPLLTALAGLFVATAINVRPERVEGEGLDWNRFQTHAIVIAITSMVLSIGLVMCAIAFPAEWVARLAFWGSAIAILIGATFLLATVWNRLSEEEKKPATKVIVKPEAEPGPACETESEGSPGLKPGRGYRPAIASASAARGEPQGRPEPPAEPDPAPKKPKAPKKKSGKKKPKKKDSKKKG